MGEKAFECADILKPLLKKYLIIGFSLVIAINITINVAGFCCIYYSSCGILVREETKEGIKRILCIINGMM